MKLSHFLVYAPCRENLEPYLATVFEIAKSAGADAKLVDVIAALPEEMGRFVTASHVRTLEELTQNERQIRLERIADELQDGITASVEIRWGKPSIELVRAAARDRSDIIFAPTESGAHGIGTEALQLTRSSPIPVWAIRTDGSRPRRILAAVDPFVYGQNRNALNLQILDTAQTLCNIFESELHVLHVWRILTDSGLQVPPTSGELERYITDTHYRHRTALDGLLAETACTVPKERAHLREGDAATAITSFVQSEAIDLLVMGSLHSLETPGHFIGSTAEKILLNLSCSAYCIKPSGFVSPVHPGPERA